MYTHRSCAKHCPHPRGPQHTACAVDAHPQVVCRTGHDCHHTQPGGHHAGHWGEAYGPAFGCLCAGVFQGGRSQHASKVPRACAPPSHMGTHVSFGHDNKQAALLLFRTSAETASSDAGGVQPTQHNDCTHTHTPLHSVPLPLHSQDVCEETGDKQAHSQLQTGLCILGREPREDRTAGATGWGRDRRHAELVLVLLLLWLSQSDATPPRSLPLHWQLAFGGLREHSTTSSGATDQNKNMFPVLSER